MVEEAEPIKVVGRVKWFNQFKGYGFIETENISGDIFLHFSAIDKSGIDRLNNNDVILCEVVKTDAGYQVSEILELLHLNKREVEGKNHEKSEATMKWFNPLKGFGFAQLDSGDDVFIHSSIIKKHRLTTIEAGKKIKLIVRYTNMGYEAVDLIL
jgi:CspA family cold shock protein